MTEPTDYERGLRDGVELARPFGTREFFGCVLLGAVIGATMAALL